MITAALLFAAASTMTESDYRSALCGSAGYAQEVTLPNGTRTDCVSETHAIEIDFAAKWAEAIGQSLNYSAETGKPPAVILICKSGTERKCLKWSLLLEQTTKHWRLPIKVWLCDADARKLADCAER